MLAGVSSALGVEAEVWEEKALNETKKRRVLAGEKEKGLQFRWVDTRGQKVEHIAMAPDAVAFGGELKSTVDRISKLQLG